MNEPNQDIPPHIPIQPTASLPPARITVVETVCFQPAHDRPTVVDSRFNRNLKTDEQPYIRKLTITEKWKPLPDGWLLSCSMLILENDSGRGQTVIPTPEQRQAFSDAVIEIGISVGADQRSVAIVPPAIFAQVPPGESCRFYPLSFKELRVRCRKGEARCTLTLLPE